MLNTNNWLKQNRGLVSKVGIIIVIFVAVIIVGLVVYNKHHNSETASQYAQNIKLANESANSTNKTAALAYARKALAGEPNSQTAIGLVASLTPNHVESQQLYGRLLSVYKKTYGSDPTPITYWAEANLAQKAGYTSQAKQYYKEAISAADSSPDKYFQTVAQESQLALRELQ